MNVVGNAAAVMLLILFASFAVRHIEAVTDHIDWWENGHAARRRRGEE